MILESVLKQILNKLDSLEQGQRNLEQGQHILTGRVDELQKGQANLASEVEGLRMSQVRMEFQHGEKISALFDDREVMRDYLESIKDSQARVEELMEKMYERQNNQEREIRPIRAGRQK